MGRRKRAFRIGLLILLITMSLNGARSLCAQDTGPRFRWRNPAPLYLGERNEIFLELINWDTRSRAPTEIFQGMAPFNAVLNESIPSLTAEGIYLYTITVIPLEESNIVIASFTHQYDTLRLNIPRISIPVLPARTPLPDTDTDGTAAINENRQFIGQPEMQLPVFPEAREKLMPFLQGEYDRVIAGVSALWDDNLLAEALAELRRHERDNITGPYLAPLRREIEQALGFGFTENERWRPFGIPILSYIIFLLVIVSLVIFLFVFGPHQKIRIKTKDKVALVLKIKKSYALLVISVLALGLVLMFLEERLGNLPSGRFRSTGRTAVLRQTQGYRVPDFRGMVNDLFTEGQPVIVSDYGSDHRFDWYYVEAPDGRSGWVPRETVITY